MLEQPQESHPAATYGSLDSAANDAKSQAASFCLAAENRIF
jgi:hypothetical protein